jgi:hypothetical protein
LAAAAKAKRNAGVARGRLDEGGLARLDLALRFQALDHGDADAVLDRGDRVEELELGKDFGLDAIGVRELVEPDDRRVADGVDDGIVDAAAAGLFTGISGHEMLLLVGASVGQASTPRQPSPSKRCRARRNFIPRMN